MMLLLLLAWSSPWAHMTSIVSSYYFSQAEPTLFSFIDRSIMSFFIGISIFVEISMVIGFKFFINFGNSLAKTSIYYIEIVCQ